MLYLIPLLLLGALLVSCSDDSPETANTDRQGSAGTSPAGAAPQHDFSNLGSIGYVDLAPEEDLDVEDGLVLHLEGHAWPGYTLYVNIPSATAYLIDIDGIERKEWHLPGALSWNRAEILPGGDILAIGIEPAAPEKNESEDTEPVPGAGFLVRMNWDGDILWRSDINIHHDVELTPEGNVLALGRILRPSTKANPKCGIEDNSLVLFSSEGDRLDQFSLYEVLRDSPEIHQFHDPHNPTECAEGIPSDCLHLNSCQWIDRPDLAERHPIFEAGNVLVSSRAQDVIFVVNFQRRELIWTFGMGRGYGPHEAVVLDSGNVLLLDNGLAGNAFSRVLEVDPTTDEIVWEYTASPPQSFFTPGRGTVQPLPNGNVLIASSGQGRIFEVNRGGRVVWHFNNPHFIEKLDDDRPVKQRAVLRAKRYAPELIEPLLD